MPGWAYGLPAKECKTDPNWHNSQTQFAAIVTRSKAVTCSKWFRMHSIEGCELYVARCGLVQWLIDQFKKKRIRHDSGDVQDEEHLLKIFAVAKLTPNTKHWMPTRESWVKAFLPECPDNLCIRFSVPMVDQAPIKSWPNVSTVISSDKPWFGLSSRVCPAPTQNNECKDCRSCWDKSIQNISYWKHWYVETSKVL